MAGLKTGGRADDWGHRPLIGAAKKFSVFGGKGGGDQIYRSTKEDINLMFIDIYLDIITYRYPRHRYPYPILITSYI